MDLPELIQTQRDFFRTDRTKSPAFRREQLRLLHSVLREAEDRLYEAIHADFGKSEFETYATELALVYHELKLALRKLGSWSRDRRVRTNLANLPGRSRVMREPLGNTLVIGAWNYPYQLTLVPAISALAAGNTVLIKPSELPTRTSEVLAGLLNSRFDPGLLHVVQGGVKETQALLEHRFDKIFFTGSIPVGKIIYQAAARHLTPVTLELGGKSPALVLADCHIPVAARRIVWAKFLNAGQTCIAPDYVLVDRSVEGPFLEALKSEIRRQHPAGKELRENYLRIINQANYARLERLLEVGPVSFGGERDPGGRVIEPTLLHPVGFGDEIMQEEIFGPLLPVVPFDRLEEAVDEVRNRPKPLACYIYSRNRKTVRTLLRQLSFGGGAVNESVMHMVNAHMPFGGVGFSGIGSYHGEAGFRCFSHEKSILKKPARFEPPFKYAPYTPGKKKLFQRLLE